MQPMDRIIFPLDGMTPAKAEEWMERLSGNVGYLKVGLEMFTRWGPRAVDVAQSHGHCVMLDLKLHDIPATMVGATSRAVELDVELLTVHASAGREALRRCVAATEDTNTSIVAVTVLTSLDDEYIQRVFQPRDNSKHLDKFVSYDVLNIVESLAKEAIDAGVDYFVCSPNEASLIRILSRDATIITPGIRLAGDKAHDQKRVNTPRVAIKNGADLLVIGRTIRESLDPIATIDDICSEIEGVGNV